MGMPASDVPDIMVPQEDGAIQEALADLDRKLAVHAAAVRDVEARLREVVQNTQAPAPQAVEDTAAEESPPTETNPPRVPPQRLKDLSTSEPAEKRKPAEPVADTPPAATPADTPTSVEPAAESAGLSEEEALLASLDEATSKAIRVMRRLNPNRSVQELLKQVEKQKDAASSAPKPAAKSWFRRK
jgi:uncharacterized coiled-coil protein SlyX